MPEEITIIIPTLNEEKNIAWVITSILNELPNAHIFVVDDGSKDNTQKIVRNYHKKQPKIILIDRSKRNHGLTASVLDGILLTKTKYFAVIDGDGQHPPEKIINFSNLLSSNVEIVVGVRKKVVNEWGFFRRYMSRIATILAKIRLLLTGTYCSDPVSGFFAGNTHLIKEIILNHPNAFVLEGYKVLFDILKIKKWKIKEYPYIFGLRRGGKSKIGNKQVIAFLKSLIN